MINYKPTLILIGHTGLIGSSLLPVLLKNHESVLAINTKKVEVWSDGVPCIQYGSDMNLNELLQGVGQAVNTIVNTSWMSNERKDRDSSSHFEFADKEISWIASAARKKIRYVSLGSIAEIKDPDISDVALSNYGRAKKSILVYLIENHPDFLWLRTMSVFGVGDRRSWILPSLADAVNRGIELEITNPQRLLNLCEVSNFSKGVATLIESPKIGAVNIRTPDWVSVSDLKNHILHGESFDRVKREFGPFSIGDPEGIELQVSSLEEDLAKYVSSYRS